MQILRKSWQRGWCPTEAYLSGNPEGLQDMSNLGFDQDGVISPLFGYRKVSSGALGAGVTQIYGKSFNLNSLLGGGYVDNSKVRYVSLDNGSVLRNYGPGFKSLTDFEITIITGGAGRAAFGFAKGWTLIASGPKQYKDNGAVQLPLGLPAPSAPGVYARYPNTIYAGNLQQGTVRTISAASNASNVSITTAVAHGYTSGVTKVRVSGFTGNWAKANNDWLVELVTSANTFTLLLDTTSFGAMTGTPVVKSIMNFTNWDTNAVEGTGYNKASDYVEITADATTFRGIVQAGRTTLGTVFTEDLTAFNSVTGTSTDEDLFKLDVNVSDTSKLIKFRLEVLLDSPEAAGTTPDVEDYYWFEWEARNPNVVSSNVEDASLIPYSVTAEQAAALQTQIDGNSEFVGSFRSGINAWSKLQCKRGQFNRVGTNDAKNWSTVKGYRVIVLGVDSVRVYVSGLAYEGGEGSNLTGIYSIVQVDVYNAGSFFDKSIPSNPSADITVFGSTITVTPNAANISANEIWLYIAGGNLDGYYRFATITSGVGSPATVDVTVSETDLLLEKERLDYYIQNLPDNITSIVDDYYDRTLYFTSDNMYPSYEDNPGGYDSRFIFKIASQDGETILWAKKVSAGLLCIGTTADIYEVTGTGAEIELSPGVVTLDYNKRGMGLAKPPVSDACVVISGSVVYYTSDGWRVLQGANGQMLDEMNRLNLFFTTQKNYMNGAVTPVRTNYNNAVYAACVYRGNKLYMSLERVSTGRFVLIFDMSKNYWSYRQVSVAANNPLSLFVEEDGTVLAGTESSGDRYLRRFDFDDYTEDGVTAPNQQFKFSTVFDDLNLPTQRKDTFTFAIDGNFGTVTPTIKLVAVYDDDTEVEKDLTGSVFNGRTLEYYDISDLGAPKKFHLTVVSTGAVFELYSISYDVNPRPVQMKYLRITNSNFGVQGRKRISEIPFVVDTVGGTSKIIPLMDNVQQPELQFTSNEKKTINYQFTEEAIARDIGGLLIAVTGVFEFYDMVPPREIELLPDSVKFKHLPYTNLGTASRKRIVQFAFVINTNGSPVAFSPFVDGVAFPPENYTTSRKQTVIYSFATEAIGIDVGGTLAGATEFEYYGPNLDECVSEKLPAATKFLRITTSNFGVANRKRIRTIPFVIDTKGSNVVFTPTVDGVAYPSTTFNTTGKTTVFYYFESDVFGVDYGGTLVGDNPFEFYEMLKPENVETLPVGKLLDQVGLMELSQSGKLYYLFVRCMATGYAMEYRIYTEENTLKHSGTFQTDPGTDTEYKIRLPHFVTGKVFRIELQSTTVFYRWSVKVRYSASGMDTDLKTVVLK